MAGGDRATSLLSLPEAYFWGCMGGLAAGVVLFILPSLLGAHRRGTAMHIDRDNVIVVLSLIVIFSLRAGVGTLFIGNVTGVSMALKLGFGAQGTIKGLLSGARDWVRPSTAAP